MKIAVASDAFMSSPYVLAVDNEVETCHPLSDHKIVRPDECSHQSNSKDNMNGCFAIHLRDDARSYFLREQLQSKEKGFCIYLRNLRNLSSSARKEK